MYNSIIIALIIAIALIGLGILLPIGFAEEALSGAELAPITVSSGGTVYHCFDEPTSVFADGAGIMIAGKATAEFISGETEITSRKTFPADKAVRHLEHGEHSEYIIALFDGKITVYNIDGTSVPFDTDQYIIDFAIYDDVLYAITTDSLITAPLGATAVDGENAKTVKITSVLHSKISAHAVGVLNGSVYVAVNSTFGSRHDILAVAGDGAANVCKMQSDNVLSITAYGDTLYTLTRDELISYEAAAGGGLITKHNTSGGEYTAVYAYGGNVYALDTLNALHKLSEDFSQHTVLFASGSDIDGYFNMPSGFAVKNSAVRVADTLNNRIAVYGDALEYSERKFINPVSVACDSAGTVYVAYEYNKIGVFPAGVLDASNERTISEPKMGAIKQIIINADKTLFVLSSTGLWAVKNGSNSPVQISQTAYKAITLGIGRDELYALGASAVYKLKPNENGYQSTAYCFAPEDGISFAIDLDGKAFILSQGRITRVYDNAETSYPLSQNGEKYELGGNAGQILLSTVKNSFVDIGDVLIADTFKHRVFKTDGDALGVRLIDENYETPDLAGSNIPYNYGNGLIRTALRETEVYALPMESEPIYKISRGRNIIVPVYTLEETREYSLILIDDTETSTLVQGYVFKDALSDPLPYSAPPATMGKIYNTATPIYKYPSRNSKPLYGYSAVDSNTTFTMLDFVESYRDDYGNMWYRLSLPGGCEGYVLSVNISTSNFEPVFIHPAYNAEIISYKDSTFAVGYILEDGEYVKTAELPTGTQVEVVGAFDSSSQYTEIRFLDAERGTLTCFVETVYINYNGVNIVLLVAIVVIIVTVILASIIVARVMYTKRKNIINDDADNNAN